MAKSVKVLAKIGAAELIKYATGKMAKRVCVRGPPPKKGPFKNASHGFYGCYGDRAAAEAKAAKVGGVRGAAKSKAKSKSKRSKK
jgi:hypothetical protein